MLRADWQTLNGPWEFDFDDQDRGTTERWFNPEKRFGRSIIVPYCFQSKLSGIGDPLFHDVVWYRRSLEIPPAWKGRRVVLHFGAVDYEARVWVNGTEAARHSGGHVSFAADVTDYLKPGANVVILRVWDPSTDLTLPRGKQYWQPQSQGIWYTRTTGIWQPVWLEAVHATHIASLRITSDVDASSVGIVATLSRQGKEVRLRATARLENRVEAQSEVLCGSLRPVVTLRLENQRLWSP
jgi:beta-galactosidase/beta-glucuronidase